MQYALGSCMHSAAGASHRCLESRRLWSRNRQDYVSQDSIAAKDYRSVIVTGWEVLQQCIDVGRGEFVSLRSVMQWDATEFVACASLSRFLCEHLVHDLRRKALVLQSTAGEAQRGARIVRDSELTVLRTRSQNGRGSAPRGTQRPIRYLNHLLCVRVVDIIHIGTESVVPDVGKRVHHIIVWEVEILVCGDCAIHWLVLQVVRSHHNQTTTVGRLLSSA